MLKSVDPPHAGRLPRDAHIDPERAIDPLGITEAREGRHSTAVASQPDPEEWYVRAEGETMADSTLNRIASTRQFIDIEGPDMREYLAEKEDGPDDARQTHGTSKTTVPFPA